ncbi:DMT family transporter [Lutispora sp.]|uniref:DMT family transporter n=1 Tax=Lutispora sp. TaxID=2828727 RepID=UPI00356A7E89
MSQQPKSPINPYFALILSVLSVSTSSIFVRFSDAPAMIISAYRMLFTLLLMTPVALVKHKEELAQITKRDGLYAIVSGLFLALHFATWITSLKLTTVAASTVLVQMSPIFVVAGSFVFFKETINKAALIGVIIAIAGSVLVGILDFRIGGTALAGDFLALAGAFFVAGYLLIGRELRKRINLLPYTFIVYGSCTVFLIAGCMLMGIPLYPYSPKNYAIFLALAFFCTILGHTVFNWALKYLPAYAVSICSLFEPVGATFLAFLLLGEIPGLLQLCGQLVVLIGLYIFIAKGN